MKNMTLLNIANACNGKLISGNHDCHREVKGVVMDSRLVKKDYLFIASKGERVDGHDYIKEAFKKGALAVVCEKVPSDIPMAYILVKDSPLALKDIAEWYRMQLNIPVVGITGSVGKTSTKEFVSSVLSQKYIVHKTEGNYNNEIGLPLTILQIKDEHEIAVLEMGINDFGEMHRLSKIAKPDYCLITNIGPCHLENLDSLHGVLKAKSEIFDFMNKNGKVVLNGDDLMLSTIQEVGGKAPIRYGLSAKNDVFADNIITHGLIGSTCDIHIKDGIFKVNIPIPGNHMILNTLAAAAVGSLLNLTATDIVQGIEKIKPTGGRNNIINLKNKTIIDDCYNANPVSMKAAIDLLSMADTRKVAILGDMGELGPDEANLHKEIGIYAGSKNIDIILCVGKLSSHMYDGTKERLINTSGRLFHFETRDDLIKALPNIIQDGDTVLVKASRFMGLETVVDELLK